MALHLLDVNALIALLWEEHQFHDRMNHWFARHARDGWATCAITQAGFVRLMSQAGQILPGKPIAEIAETLASNVGHETHQLLHLDFDFSDVLACCNGGVMGHRQVTDAYLLTAAMRAGGRLLTFDQGLPMLLASEAERERHVLVLG